MSTQFTVRAFGIVEDRDGLALTDGVFLVASANGREIALQTDDYAIAWETANRLSRDNGFNGGSVHTAGVVIGENDVAPLARCESEHRYGSGTFECPLKGTPRHRNLAGYHPCNR